MSAASTLEQLLPAVARRAQRLLHAEACEVADLDEKRVGLDLLVDHIIPGRSGDARPPTEKELRSTMLLALSLGESSAKVRQGWPLDEDEDYDFEVWAGVVPIRQVFGTPIADPRLAPSTPIPDHIAVLAPGTDFTEAMRRLAAPAGGYAAHEAVPAAS